MIKRVLRSIQPRTSTSNRVLNPNAKLSGLAHMSIGRYMSQQNREENHWNVPTYETITPPKPKIQPKIIPNKIECIIEKMENYDCNDGYSISLDFKGICFKNNTFKKSSKSDNSYYIEITYNNKDVYLFITTTSDIFEIEIVLSEKNIIQTRGVNQIFYDELYIPELLKFIESNEMTVILKNKNIYVTYNKSVFKN